MNILTITEITGFLHKFNDLRKNFFLRISGELNREFDLELARINYFRAWGLSILFVPVTCILMYTDYTAREGGLWNQEAGYRLLFLMHLMLFLVTFALTLLSFAKKLSDAGSNRGRSIFTQVFISFFLIFGAGVSAIDQLIHGEITVFIFTSIAIAAIFYQRPQKSVIGYLASYILFLAGITKFQSNFNILRGHYINGTLIVLVAVLLSIALYEMKAQDFLSRKTIERQKNELQAANGDLILANHQLQESLRALDESQNMIFTLAFALESKDPYTHGHSKRVADYALQIAGFIGLPQKTQENLRLAAILHDIGKIGIPDAILNKPGRLNIEEWQIMKSHPERGEIICSKLNFTREILPVIRHHHERYDGQGYPDGLKGEKIPYLARIIMIADAVDAITSQRSYRSPRNFQVALEELNKGAGNQFDPKLADIFAQLYHSGQFSAMKEYKEII